MWRLVFFFVVLLPLLAVCSVYVLHRVGLLRLSGRESKNVRKAREQLEESRLLDEMRRDYEREYETHERDL